MLDITLTLKNFRCFEDSEPAVIHLKSGVTAFVGPNNSGKSSLLRMFFEFRTFFGLLHGGGIIQELLRGNPIGVNFAQVPDPTALQYDDNERPMILGLDCVGISEPDSLSAIEFSFSRSSPTNPTAKFFVGPSRTAVLTDNRAKQVDPNVYHTPANGVRINTLQFVERIRALTSTVYLGAFRNALNKGAATYFDLDVGTAFVHLWDQWKNGDNRRNNRAIKNVEDAIGRLFRFERLEINPSPNNETLRVFVNRVSFDLQEQGSGLAQFVLAFGTAATRQSSLILIDEPELNLHPSLQIDFLTTLGTFASEGVLFSTHSIGLARSVAETIYSVQRRGNRSILRYYEETPSIVEFAGEMSFSASRELGYDCLLLVEGPTDVRTIQQLLRKLSKDRRVVIFPLLGHVFASGNHTDALVELTRVAPASQIAAFVDSERAGEDQPPDARRDTFRKACEKLGFKVHLTKRRAIENYFPLAAIREGVGEQYDALGPYEKLGVSPKNWSKSLNWKIAHAIDLQDLKGTDLLEFLQGL